ncbi:hypothetical protein ACJJTC_012766 [Scirpophaga incertulas]
MVNEEPTLNTLFDELNKRDITEPASMDLLISLFDELTENSDQYMQLLAEKLQYASITWKQPWYQVSQRLTRPFRETADNDEEQYCTGTMTVDEKRKIQKNWQKLVEEYNIPDKLIYVAMWKNRENDRFIGKEKARTFVYAYLARGLQRNLNQVYRYVVSHYAGVNKGNLSSDEERVLQICFMHDPKRAVVYASTILQRESRIIYMRLHQSINGKPCKSRTKWTLPLATKFVKCLMEYSGESLEGLKNKKFSMDVWTKLSEEFDKPKVYLRYFWTSKLHNQLFVKCKVKLRHLKRSIFKVLQSSPYKVWSDIRWLQVQSKFPDGFTHIMLYHTSVRTAQQCPNYCKIPLAEIVNHGFDMTRSGRRVANAKKRMITLILNKEGNLEPIEYDNKLQVKLF